MTKTLTKVEAHPMTLATELYLLEANADALDTKIKSIRAELLEALQNQGVRRVDLENGDSYLVYPRNKLVIKDKLAANKWAWENPEARMKLDTAKAIEVALMGKLKWAKVEKEEYLRVSHKKHGEDSE